MCLSFCIYVRLVNSVTITITHTLRFLSAHVINSCLPIILSAVKIKKNPDNTKFKVRCSRFLYTLVIVESEKADKLKQSLPPGKNRCNINFLKHLCLNFVFLFEVLLWLHVLFLPLQVFKLKKLNSYLCRC